MIDFLKPIKFLQPKNKVTNYIGFLYMLLTRGADGFRACRTFRGEFLPPPRAIRRNKRRF